LRRRFEIFECIPDGSTLQAFYDQEKGVSHVYDLVAGFEALNADLTTQLDKHRTIGQTFFMAGEMTVSVLRRVWGRKVVFAATLSVHESATFGVHESATFRDHRSAGR
jgi:hypothetical protein